MELKLWVGPSALNQPKSPFAWGAAQAGINRAFGPSFFLLSHTLNSYGSAKAI
jgi:hypothetical protein